MTRMVPYHPIFTILFLSFVFKTLSMLRLLPSNAWGREDFVKSSEPCHVGIYWIAPAEYSHMSTHVPCLSNFSGFCFILYWQNQSPAALWLNTLQKRRPLFIQILSIHCRTGQPFDSYFLGQKTDVHNIIYSLDKKEHFFQIWYKPDKAPSEWSFSPFFVRWGINRVEIFFTFFCR